MMRLHRTPASWRPSGAVLRFVSFGDEGRPWWTIGFSLVALALTGVLGADLVKGLARGAHVPSWAILLVLGFLAVALGCAYFAADRLLRGPDGAVELDPARRAILILRRRGIEGASGEPQPRELGLPFDGIESIGVASQQVVTQYVFKRTGENAYRESKTLLRVVALPMGVVLLRDEIAKATARDRAAAIAAMVGVPVRELG